MKRRIFSILIALSMLCAMLPVVASAADVPTDFNGWMAKLNDRSYVNVAAGKTVTASGLTIDDTYKNRLVDGNWVPSKSAEVADWVNIPQSGYIKIDLGESKKLVGAGISRRGYGEVNRLGLQIWGSDTDLGARPTASTSGATLLAEIAQNVTDEIDAITSTNSFRYIYVTNDGGTSTAQNGFLEIFVIAEKNSDPRLQDVLSGLTGIDNYGNEITKLTDGDRNEYYDSYGQSMNANSQSAGDWVRFDLGYECSLKYFAINNEGAAGFYQQKNLMLKAGNTTDISQATNLVGNVTTYKNVGILWEIGGKYRYIWVYANGNDSFCDDVRVYGVDDRVYQLGDWSVVDNGSTVTATLPVEYINSEAQELCMYIANYDADGAMVGEAMMEAFTREDENAGDSKETQTLTTSVPSSVAVDHTQVVVVDEAFNVVSIHNENYGGTWAGFSAAKGSADVFEGSVSKSASAQYPFDNQSVTISGKAVEADDLIMIQVMPMASTFAAEAIEDVLYQAFAIADNGYEFNIPIGEGTYEIVVSRYPADGSAEDPEIFTHEVIAADTIRGAINAFFPTDETPVPDYAAALANAIDTVGIIGEVDLVDTRAIVENDDFAAVAADIADIMRVEDDVTGDIAMNTDELLDVINTMIVVYKLSDGETSVMDEHGEYITGNADVQAYVAENLPYALNADVECQSDMAGLTNLDESGVVKFTFTEAMKPATLTEDTIIIKKGDDEVNYDVAKVTEDEFWVDLGSLESDSSYVITFTNQCKTTADKYMLEPVEYEFTTGKILDFPYKDGKVIKNILLNKPIVNADSVQVYGSGKSHATAGVSVLNDGEKPNSGATKTTAIKPSQNVIFDLGGFYEPIGVSQYYYMGTTTYSDSSGYYWYHAAKLSFYGCAYPELDENDVPTVASFKQKGVQFAYTGDSYGTKDPLTTTFMVHSLLRPITGTYKDNLDAFGPVRYISFSTSAEANMNAYNSEIEVYAYVDTELDAIKVNNETVTANSTYQFTLPVIKNPENKTWQMIISAYDENGTALKTEVAQISSSSQNATITAPAGTRGITAVAVDSLSAMNPVAAPLTIGQKPPVAATTKTGVSVTADTEKIVAEAGKNNDVIETSNMIVIAVAEDEANGITGTVDAVFANITAAQLEAKGAYMYSEVVNDGKSFAIEGLPYGKYYVKAVASTIDASKRQEVLYKQAILDETTKQNLMNAIMTSDGDALADAVYNAVYEEEAISADGMYDTESFDDKLENERFITILEYTREAIYPTVPDSITTEAVRDMLNAALTVYALENKDAAAATLLEENGAAFGENFIAEADAEKAADIYYELKDEVVDGASLNETIEWSCLLAFAKGASAADLAKAMEDYSDKYGIDLSYASSRGVALSRAAKFIEKDNVASLYGEEAFGSAYEAAVKKALSAAQGTSGSKNETGTFGGLSSGSQSSRGEKEEAKPTPKPVATPEPAKSGFADMQGFAWADEAVAKLVQAGVINGNEKGEFEPSRNVTRGEFVKMLIVASKIKVDEGTSTHFVDVPDSSWQHPYVQIAFSRGICRGVDDFTFNVNGAITRQDMAVMITNLLNNMSVNTSGDAIDFTDAGTIADYAVSAVDTASKAGLINGFDDGSFRPRDNTRRVDAAMVISKLMEKIN